MKRISFMLMLLIALPLQAASLKFQFGGTYSAGEEYPDGTFNVSYQLNTMPTDFTYADVLDPSGRTVHDYFTGVPRFSVSSDSSGTMPFSHIEALSVQFDDRAPLALRPFSLSQSISSIGYNRYQYQFQLWVAGDRFGFLAYNLSFSPRPEDGPWDKALIESLTDPDMLLTRAVLGGTSPAYMELSQFNYGLNVNRFAITSAAAQIPEPSAVALIAAGLILLLLATSRVRRPARRRD
ncbi:hypothetical protein [Propionivibrio soli]|uniref:hypothetical protein n=1 Tax=Propionivibrio soli TaxID=2976531 RepID=UPI0021E7D092|nr:hypothetical protein [Propionivibrio soli]